MYIYMSTYIYIQPLYIPIVPVLATATTLIYPLNKPYYILGVWQARHQLEMFQAPHTAVVGCADCPATWIQPGDSSTKMAMFQHILTPLANISQH